MRGRRNLWPDGGRALFRRQLGVVRRDQLRALGVTWASIEADVGARRWTVLGPHVLVMDNGRLDVEQLRWAAVLHYGGSAALCAWTALQVWGLQGFERSDVHVVVPRGSAVTPAPRLPAVRTDGVRTGSTGRSVSGIVRPRVVLHESRRHQEADVVRREGFPPAHRASRAAIDAGAWGPTGRAAAAVVLASVNRRLASPDEVLGELEVAGRIRRRQLMRSVAADAAGGVDALSELDFARLCRAAGVPEPRRQRRRRDAEGRWRYLDVLWIRTDGRRVVVEVDGRGHIEVERWEDDLMRANDVTIGDQAIVLRVPGTLARAEPRRVLAQVSRALGLGELSPPRRRRA